MSAAIPEAYLDLFERPALAFLGCRLPNGLLQVNPVWCDFDGADVRVNVVRGSVKERALRRDPTVTVCVADPDNPNRYLEVRGEVAAWHEEGAEAHVDALAYRYQGAPFAGRRPGQQRVIVHIRPRRVTTFTA